MFKNYDVYADDAAPSPGWGPWWDAIGKIQGQWSSESGWGGDYWGNLPTRIRAAYLFIENAKALPLQNVPQSDVDLMKAECRFLIAYYYYLLVNTYGAIPLQTWLSNYTDSPEQLMIGQNPYDDVVEWIDTEMQAVAKLLPAYYSDTRKYGRATSIACHAVRARLLLFAASPLVNGNTDQGYADFENDKGEKVFNSTYDANKWKKAADACRELITLAESSGYGLNYDYNDDGTIDPFLSYYNAFFKEFNQGNKEILFSRPHDSDYSEYDKHAQPYGMQGNGGLGVTQSIVDAFFMTNGLSPITGYNPDGSPVINTVSGYTEKGFSTTDDVRKTKWIQGAASASTTNPENIVVPSGIYNMYVNREPRFYISVLFNEGYHRPGGRAVNLYINQLDNPGTHDAPQYGYLLRKRVSMESYSAGGTYPYRDGILYRLGEVYLNYAEALNEWDPSQSAEILKYLNLIRERAGIPTYGSGTDQITAPATQAAMRLAIKRERRVELNSEFMIRFDDIRRWMEIEDVLNGWDYGMNWKGSEKSDDPNNPNAFYVRTKTMERGFTKKNHWLPIHQNQMDKNLNLRQLPYW